MAKLPTIDLILTISWLLVLTTHVYARKLRDNAAAKPFHLHIGGGKEKVAKFDIYVHDLRVGSPKPTVYQVAEASITDTSPTTFGSVDAVDDLVTAGPRINSAAVGRIQGLTTSADLSVSGVMLNLNIVFTAEGVSGSTLCILGRNPVMEKQRELAVVGGTGVFRFARGYAVQSTTFYDTKMNYGVFKYSIYTTYNSIFTESDEVDIAEE